MKAPAVDVNVTLASLKRSPYASIPLCDCFVYFTQSAPGRLFRPRSQVLPTAAAAEITAFLLRNLGALPRLAAVGTLSSLCLCARAFLLSHFLQAFPAQNKRA